MKTTLKRLFFYGTLMCAILTTNNTMANNKLSDKEKKIVVASALAARGNLNELKTAVNDGLNSSVSLDEYREIFVQIYAYCGFPKSLNALGVLFNAAKERGLNLKAAPYARLKDSLKTGAENQTKLVGREVKGELFEFAPAIDEYLKAHLFGDIFARNNLDWRTREIATVAMLAGLENVIPQLNAHIGIAKNNGVSDTEIGEILGIVQNQVIAKTGIFPFGEENVAYAKYFSGKSYLARLLSNKDLNVSIANVSFEPSCRNNWHSHTGGQILIAVSGTGFYQEKGKAARKLNVGDVVEIAPNVVHWHGAAPNSNFAHLAIECNASTNKNSWYEPVGDEEYKKATEE